LRERTLILIGDATNVFWRCDKRDWRRGIDHHYFLSPSKIEIDIT
jgi:hypothetical protein